MRQRKPKRVVSQKRRDAATKRWHPKRGDSEEAKPKGTTLATAKSRKASTIATYDKIVGDPETWQDAKAREGVIGELLANDAKRTDLEVRRGALLTREQVAERDRVFDELVFASLSLIPDRMAELVAPEAKNEARRIGRELIVEIRRRVAEGIAEHRPG